MRTSWEQLPFLDSNAENESESARVKGGDSHKSKTGYYVPRGRMRLGPDPPGKLDDSHSVLRDL